MPIEVRELVIKATVSQDNSSGATTSSTPTNNSIPANDDIVNACVQKILEILKDKHER